MPEIVRCPGCDEETYRSLAQCPHCGDRMPPHLSLDPLPLPRDDRRSPSLIERLPVILVLVAGGLLLKMCLLG